jgi:hypothetical protein
MSGRVYPMDLVTKVVLWASAVVFAGGGLSFTGYGLSLLHGSDRLACAGLGVVLALPAVFCVALTIRRAVVLYPDRIEKRDVFGSKSMMKSDIASYRTVVRPNQPVYMVLTSKPPMYDTLSIDRYNTDAEFDRWFEGIHDLTNRKPFGA